MSLRYAYAFHWCSGAPDGLLHRVNHHYGSPGAVASCGLRFHRTGALWKRTTIGERCESCRALMSSQEREEELFGPGWFVIPGRTKTHYLSGHSSRAWCGRDSEVWRRVFTLSDRCKKCDMMARFIKEDEMATGKKKVRRKRYQGGEREVLFSWPAAEESDPSELEFVQYRIVGLESEPGIFDHAVEGQTVDAMGEPSWRQLLPDSILGALSDLAWHLWKKKQQ